MNDGHCDCTVPNFAVGECIWLWRGAMLCLVVPWENVPGSSQQDKLNYMMKMTGSEMDELVEKGAMRCKVTAGDVLVVPPASLVLSKVEAGAAGSSCEGARWGFLELKLPESASWSATPLDW